MKQVLILVLALAVPAVIRAGDKHEHPAKAVSKEFETLKSLAGNWKGSAEMGGKTETVTTSFRVTSGGSAVVETMGADTPHEMTNVYHDVDGKLMMTHYCAMGNAPQMKAAKGDGKTLSFAAVKANGIDPKKTPHMHSLVYALDGKDVLTATWTSANMGKEHEAPMTFSYKRVD